jgi:tRNA threonylcarbamoyladenosine biosynthesis protein TsaB
MPTILAIETTTELASCALLRGDALMSRQSSGVQTHSHALLPMVQELLAEAGLKLADCDAVAFGAGPGSFTGVRTGCGVAQGLAFGAGLRVVPVVTLEAMAQAAREQHGADEVLALLDARMGEVYWAQYHFENGAWRTVAAPALAAPGAVAPHPAASLAWVGNGLSAFPGAFPAQSAYPAVMPHAAQVARLGALLYAAGASVEPEAAQPLYLRNKVAYTSAERAAGVQRSAA